MMDRDAKTLPGGLLVMRNDGLGARLMPILNALRLGSLLDIPVYIYWPTYLVGHNTAEVDTLFHADFRAKSFLTPATYQAIKKTRSLTPEADIARLTGADLKAACAAGALFFFDNTENDVALLGEDPETVKTGLSRALPDHLLTDAIAKQMAAIRARLKDAAPLVYHVRHGDLTHSYKTRAGEWTNKYIPNEIYLAHMRTNGIGPDRPAVLIGDCLDAINWIADRQPGVSRIDHMLDTAGLGSLQFDFMELYTMSRAAKIVCPDHSGFSKMAARIGNLPVEDVKNSLHADVLASALADLEKRLWIDRGSFTNDGDAAQSMLHLRDPSAEVPTAAMDGLVRREIEAGSTVPFLFRYKADAALRAGDIDGLVATADQAHRAMLNDPRAVATVNALAAQGLLATGDTKAGLRHLRRAAYLMPTVPPMGPPLMAHLQSDEDAHLHRDFFPTGFTRQILSYPAVWRVILVHGFAWEAWPFLQDRFQVMLHRGHGYKTFLAHTQKLLAACGTAGDAMSASMVKGLLHLVAFYDTKDTADLAALKSLAAASNPAHDPIPTQRLALAHLFAGDQDSARDLLMILTEAQPNIRAYHGLLGQILFQQKAFEEALTHFDIANPGRVDFLRFAGPQIRLSDRANRVEAAHSLFVSLLSETAWSDTHLTHYCRRDLTAAQAQAMIDRLTRALPEMEKARPTHAQLAALYAGQGQTDQAAAHFIQALDLGLIPPALLTDATQLAEQSKNQTLMAAIETQKAR